MPQLDSIAKDIIRKSIYMTLATSDGAAPWASPLYYVYDGKNTFYFLSQIDSLHSQNIAHNPQISFAIFDSRQPAGTGNGVQGKGQAHLLSDDEVAEARNHYCISPENTAFADNPLYRFYKIIPDSLYVLDPSSSIDVRKEVSV